MFKYEDMDFQSLTTSLDIENPDGPEELYAMAQFCRMGKGTQASEENYRFYLQRAADAGSEQAKQELDALDNADAASAAEPPEEARAVEGMSLPELIQAADNGNPYALLPLAKKAMTKEFLDLPKARQWLEKAAAQVPQGVYGDKDATDIYLLLGGLLKNKQFDTPENRTACHRYYSLAAEMGSGEACDELADQYENGYGCTADPEKAKFYRDRGAKKNDPVYLCAQCYKMLTENGSRLELVDMLARVRTLTQDQDILNFVDLLSAAGGFGELKPETAEWAWEQEKDSQIWFSFPGQEKAFDLGKILAEAYGTDPQAAIARGLPVDGEKAGLIADWMPTLDKSYPWAKYGAEQHDRLAMCWMGDCYRLGYCTEKNPEAAFENYLESANAGLYAAMAELANCYRIGFGTAPNTQKALEWAQKAANAGNSRGMVILAWLYRDAPSIQDYGKMRYWLEKSAERGDPNAQCDLGVMYTKGNGVRQDYTKAKEFFEKAADKGNETALFNLGCMYDTGMGVTQNYAKAAELYQKAADRGNPFAMGNLGTFYKIGRGVPQNAAKAAELYQQASDRNNAVATCNLASLYEKGNGVPQDNAKAFALYKKAESMGKCDHLSLCNCYINGLGTERNFDLALQYAIGAYEKDGVSKEQTCKNLIIIANHAKANDPGYNRVPIYTKAIELGSVDAMLALARMYETGDGVAQDLDKAESCYKDAARAGNKEAVDWLIAKRNGTLPAASAPAQTHTDPLLQQAADLLKNKTPSDARTLVKVQLSLREDDPEAARLLAALNAQEAEADNVYKEAMSHRAQQKAALEAGNTPLAIIEGDTCKRILQEAAASGHAEAAAELDRMQKAEDALQEAEHRLADRSNPDERGNIEVLLQQGAACCLPQAIELLNPMLAEDRAAEEKYNQAMDCIRAGGAGDKDKAISLLNECQTVGHKRAADTLSLLKEDYIKQQMLSGGMTRIDAEMQWDARYAQSEQELFSRANALLNGGNDPAEREHVEKLLQMRSAGNPEAKRLLQALHDRDSNARRELDEARRCLQTAAGSKKPADAEAERQKAIDLLQSAAAKGSPDAQDELAHVQNGPALLTEAEKVMVSRRKPGMRAKAREMLEKADGCGLPRVTELLNMLQREETEAQTNYQNALTLLNTDSADNRRHAISLLKQNANAGFTQSADLLKQIGVGQPSANNRTAPDPEPIYSSSTQDDSTLLSDDREALGEKLAGGVLLFVVAEILGSVLANIPAVGFVLSTLCSIAALIGLVIGGYASVQVHLVHHIPLSDPDMRRGYYKAPAMLGNLLLSLFTKKK